MIVKLKIDSQMYADYLAYLFPPNEDGVLMVSSEELMGKLLISHCRESFRKTEISEEGIVVTLMMPQCPATQNLRILQVIIAKLKAWVLPKKTSLKHSLSPGS